VIFTYQEKIEDFPGGVGTLVLHYSV